MARALERVAPEDVVQVGESLLRENHDWAGAIIELLAVERKALFERTAALRVPNVQPTALPLHIAPGHFAVVANHYDRDALEAQKSSGAITPHTHHFSFASRVCRGALYHLRFTNAGNVGTPDLTLQDASWLREGNVFLLDCPDYHLVLEAAPNSVTLMVRGPAQFRNPHLGDADFSPGALDKIVSAVTKACASLLA